MNHETRRGLIPGVRFESPMPSRDWWRCWFAGRALQSVLSKQSPDDVIADAMSGRSIVHAQAVDHADFLLAELEKDTEPNDDEMRALGERLMGLVDRGDTLPDPEEVAFVGTK